MIKLANRIRLRRSVRKAIHRHVPSDGGVVLASNHQSWLDVQVLGASCPRRVHFVAKSEFRDWPVLRHLIELSQSIFVKRGGDAQGLEAILGDGQVPFDFFGGSFAEV